MRLFSTGEGLLVHDDWKTDEDIQAVFATNVLGHYIMVTMVTVTMVITDCTQVKELEDSLKTQTESCHIIWTSSNTAKTANLDVNDIQNKKWYEFDNQC